MENDSTRCADSEVDDAVDLSADKLIDVEEEVKVVAKSSRTLSFRERMKTLLL